jgi:hypothetical protein
MLVLLPLHISSKACLHATLQLLLTTKLTLVSPEAVRPAEDVPCHHSSQGPQPPRHHQQILVLLLLLLLLLRLLRLLLLFRDSFTLSRFCSTESGCMHLNCC